MIERQLFNVIVNISNDRKTTVQCYNKSALEPQSLLNQM